MGASTPGRGRGRGRGDQRRQRLRRGAIFALRCAVAHTLVANRLLRRNFPAAIQYQVHFVFVSNSSPWTYITGRWTQ